MALVMNMLDFPKLNAINSLGYQDILASDQKNKKNVNKISTDKIYLGWT